VNRLRKWWKPGLLILLVVIAAQVGVSLLVRTARARVFLTRQLQISFGRAVEVREYSASLFPSPQLDADGITVYEDPDFGHEYFLRAERLSAGLRWLGFLRGRFELGTLELERPSLIFSRDQEGRWNLERWLPAATPASRVAGGTSSPAVQATPAYHLQKIEISDGRVNFKLGDEKTSFAFIQVEGSVEQAAPGRWRMDLKAQPWRSGVPLQLAGTVRVHGDVAGTSTRLQPAKFLVSWEKSSLADVFRLIGGADFGVRGTFAGEATVESGAVSAPGVRNAARGDWLLSVQARASGIHRWDLTEREDNPRVVARLNGRWNPGAGIVQADELVVETPRSNLRGVASLKSIAGSNFAVRVDSAGIQAADLLDWYRAFRPGVAEGIQASQYFTGGANLTGWPLIVNEVAFSSSGGRWTMPNFAAPFEVRAVRGGTQKRKLVIEPFAVSIPAAISATGAKGKESGSASAAANVELSLLHDLDSRTGGIRLASRAARIEDVVAIASAFGRQLQSGWELKGKVNADLRWEWSPDAPPAWNGRAEVTQGKLQVAGLNQPVELENFRAEWHNARRKFTLGQVNAFGASWTGTVEQLGSVATDFGETELLAWSFQLHADHLDAAELDRWMGPRARPSWLQRLLPAGLGGAAAPPPSVLLQRIRAEGELRADELAIEKIKLRQFEAHAKLAAFQLGLRNVRAQWSGGEVSGTAQAEFSAKPRYSIDAGLEKIVIAQTPWLARASDRLAGTVSGSVEIHAEGIGRDALIESLAGKGELRLTNVELRGWDLPATMAVGEWKTGNSRWATGAGTFHVSNGGFDLNSLRLTSPSGEFLLKGSVSFSEDADMTAESHAAGRKAVPQNTVRFLQISGPLSGLKVSLEKATAQQPGD
jgi:AsmA-like protein